MATLRSEKNVQGKRVSRNYARVKKLLLSQPTPLNHPVSTEWAALPNSMQTTQKSRDTLLLRTEITGLVCPLKLGDSGEKTKGWGM